MVYTAIKSDSIRNSSGWSLGKLIFGLPALGDQYEGFCLKDIMNKKRSYLSFVN